MTPAPDVSESEDVGDAPLPGARSALLLLLGINLFNYIDRQVLSAVEPQIRAHFFPGASEQNALAKTGLLATAFLVSYMLTAPVFGYLADRMSRWLIVGLSVILWSLATGASGLAGTFAMLLITRCFVGVGEAGYGPAAPTIIADFYPVRRRGAVLAWFYLALPIGAALGYGVGGYLGNRYGWRMAFYAVTPWGLVLGVIAFMMKSPPRGAADAVATSDSSESKPKSADREPRMAQYLTLARIPSYVLATAGMAAMTFAIGGIQFFMPAYLVWRKAGDLEHVNLVFGGILVVSGFAATLLGGWLGDRLGARFPGSYFLVSACGILVAAPLVLGILATPFPLAWIFVFLAVFFLFFNTGPANTILANVTHPSIRATAFAINILIIHALGDAVSPPLLGRIVGPTVMTDGTKVFRWNAAFLLVSAVMGLAGILWAFGTRFLSIDTKRVAGAR